MRVCKRCLMDTNVEGISFDKDGICNFCKDIETLLEQRWRPNVEGEKLLTELIQNIKKEGKGKPYDCVLGLSGGVDSSYLAYLASQKWGLRILAIHVNAGWNSEIAESNIEKLVNKYKIDLFTYVVDWEEMKDLQLSYFKSGIINLDIPQDHVYFAQLYKKSAQEKIKYVLTGHNLATESISVPSWAGNGDAMDSKQLYYIQNKFGKVKLKSYTTISLFSRLYNVFVLGQNVVKPLDLIPYNKEQAITFLENEIGWRGYGVKHGESVFTRFFQNYWLTERFNIDKRKGHLTSMIMSGLITKDKAQEELNIPLYEPHQLSLDIEFICNKLEISKEQLDTYLTMEKVDASKFPSNKKIISSIMYLKNRLRFRENA